MTHATAFPGDTPEPPGLPELTFASGLPGFPDARRFVLVRIGDEAPRSVSVHREEVFRELEAANREAASPASGALEGLAALRPPPERRSR
jgi:hypothetical protein